MAARGFEMAAWPLDMAAKAFDVATQAFDMAAQGFNMAARRSKALAGVLKPPHRRFDGDMARAHSHSRSRIRPAKRSQRWSTDRIWHFFPTRRAECRGRLCPHFDALAAGFGRGIRTKREDPCHAAANGPGRIAFHALSRLFLRSSGSPGRVLVGW